MINVYNWQILESVFCQVSKAMIKIADSPIDKFTTYIPPQVEDLK